MRSGESGFTLIELLAVILITATIAGISVASFRKAEKQKRAVIAADIVINAIRNSQNFTLTGKNISNSSCAISKAPVSYILRVSNTTTWVVWAEDACGVFNLIESYTLPAGTNNSSNLTINGSVVSGLQIKFKPPFGAMTASSDVTLGAGSFSNFTTISIDVQTADGAVTKTVTVDGVSGRIE